MDIAVIGTGYVGLCSGAGLASRGHRVTCIGRDQGKIDNINKGIPPIYEEGLEELLKQLTAEGKLKATNDISAAKDAQVTFICVGTPSGEDGRIDLEQIETASRQLGEALKVMDYHVFVVKSTVVPGTTDKVVKILEEASGKRAGQDFGACMNPEFLREGKALDDFLKPDRVVVGELDKRSGDVLEEIYNSFGAPILRTTLGTAEMIKYASNSLLATKISFSNEIGNICKKLGIDTYDVMKGVGLDHRISPKFLEAGIGWGGSCFPKDVSALKSLGEDSGSDVSLLSSVIDVNKRQKLKIVKQLEGKIGSLQGKTIGLLGLAFKGGTDDIREAPSLEIIKALLGKGAVVKAYDPQAAENVRKLFTDITYAENPQKAVEAADACLILTDWDEFRGLKDGDFAGMKQKLILEGRKVLTGVSGVEGVCW